MDEHEKTFQAAIETAIYAIRVADDHQEWDKHEETGWRNDAFCDAYQVLNSFYRTRWPEDKQ